MTNEQLTDLSAVFVRLITGGDAWHDSGTAPFTVQYGYVQEVCKHDGVRILNCPPAVLNTVIEWARNQTGYVGVSVHDGAVFVR